jgi:hypothetical protein
LANAWGEALASAPSPAASWSSWATGASALLESEAGAFALRDRKKAIRSAVRRDGPIDKPGNVSPSLLQGSWQTGRESTGGFRDQPESGVRESVAFLAKAIALRLQVPHAPTQNGEFCCSCSQTLLGGCETHVNLRGMLFGVSTQPHLFIEARARLRQRGP